MSDAWINGLTYTRIWFQGTDIVKGNQYTRGKDQGGGGCTYKHWDTARGQCLCQSININMSAQFRSSHRGLGDWPYDGALHTAHVGEWWYFKKARQHLSWLGGYCHGRGSARCDIMLYVR